MIKDNSLKVVLTYIITYFSLPFIILIYLLVQNKENTNLLENIISNLTFYVVNAVLIIAVTKEFLINQLQKLRENVLKHSLLILIGFGSIFITSMLVGLFLKLIDFNEPANNQEAWNTIMQSGTFGLVSTVVLSVFLAPIVEELVFRYAGFAILRKFKISSKLEPFIIILTTSLAFGLIHVLNDDPLQLLFYAGLGGVLGYFYYRSNNIFVPILIHFMWNLFAIGTMFIQ